MVLRAAHRQRFSPLLLVLAAFHAGRAGGGMCEAFLFEVQDRDRGGPGIGKDIVTKTYAFPTRKSRGAALFLEGLRLRGLDGVDVHEKPVNDRAAEPVSVLKVTAEKQCFRLVADLIALISYPSPSILSPEDYKRMGLEPPGPPPFEEGTYDLGAKNNKVLFDYMRQYSEKSMVKDVTLQDGRLKVVAIKGMHDVLARISNALKDFH